MGCHGRHAGRELCIPLLFRNFLLARSLTLRAPSMHLRCLMPLGPDIRWRRPSYRAAAAVSKRVGIPTHARKGCAPSRIALPTATYELARVAEMLHFATPTLGGSLASRSIHDAAAPGGTPITCLSGGGHRKSVAYGSP